MVGPEGSQAARRSQSQKADRSPDRSLQLDCVKSESLVIADQHVAVNTFPGLVHTARHTICSEVVADFMIDCLKIDDDRLSDADWLTPKDIVAVCETHGIRSLKQVKPWP